MKPPYDTTRTGILLRAHVYGGYDTSGIQKFIKSKNWLHILDGFYISDRENADGTGKLIPNVYIEVYLQLGANIVLGVIRAGASGRLTLTARLSPHPRS